jgi:SAM-dependent methyltransferase
MLAAARARWPEIEWIESDFRALPAAVEPFDFAYSSCNTLQSVPADDFAAVLAGVRRLLRTGGVFSFEIFQPNRDYMRNGHQDRLVRRFTHPQFGALEIHEDLVWDATQDAVAIDWRVVDPERQAVLCATRFMLWQHDHDDMRRLLRDGGFAVRAVCGGIDRSPFSAASKKQVFVCAV